MNISEVAAKFHMTPATIRSMRSKGCFRRSPETSWVFETFRKRILSGSNLLSTCAILAYPSSHWRGIQPSINRAMRRYWNGRKS